MSAWCVFFGRKQIHAFCGQLRQVVREHLARGGIDRNLTILVALPIDLHSPTPLAKRDMLTLEQTDFSCPETSVEHEHNNRPITQSAGRRDGGDQGILVDLVFEVGCIAIKCLLATR